MKKKVIIGISVTCGVLVAAGLGVLIWWLVTRGENGDSGGGGGGGGDEDGGGYEDPYTVIELEGEGIGPIPYTAAFTRIRDVGDVFWWFYPSTSTGPTSRPLILWLDGVTGVAPSLLANLGMIGPYDVNFESRPDSWISRCNLLFIDAPIGTGFSTPLDESKIPRTDAENVEHIITVLESFYSKHSQYINTPLYIFGQGDGGKTAVTLATMLNTQLLPTQRANIKGIALGNAVIAPAVALSKLGFYLEELGYIDGVGRTNVERFSLIVNSLILFETWGPAFDYYITMNEYINEDGGAVAVNLRHIIEKMTRDPAGNRDNLEQRCYTSRVLGVEAVDFMTRVVAPALGISSSVNYDSYRLAALQALRNSYLTPATRDIEYILQNTDLTVSIYNGNLDAISNTPGQLEWVNNLQWFGQNQFKNSPRQTLIVNRLVEGYFRETGRLKFYWINAAGQSAPLDNPVALNSILSRIIPTLPGAEEDLDPPYTIVELEGDGIGSIPYTAAFTRIQDIGDVFWWFYPTVGSEPVTRPIVLWLDGVTGVPPSLLANLGMIGPYDVNFDSRPDSWIHHCNLLFIDAPLGTGFSTPLNTDKIPKDVNENVDQLYLVLQSFYNKHSEFRNTPLYIFGQGDGGKTAAALAIKLHEDRANSINIKGIALGNPIISPSLALTKLGFYLEELGYIDSNGRTSIDLRTEAIHIMVNVGFLPQAFNTFITMSDYVNSNAGAVAVNLGHIIEKLTRDSAYNHRDYFNRTSYVSSTLGIDTSNLMNRVADALGIDPSITYDAYRDDALDAVRGSFMAPFTREIERILQSTDLSVTIYNGNLDAISNTPGQLEWVNNLQWHGQPEFLSSPRQTLVVNRLVEGYFREVDRLTFYWVNAAGQSAPLHNQPALYRILTRMIGS